MAITMQGSWLVQVRVRDAAYAQRVVIEGADVGNGMHDGIVGERVYVSGAHWTLQVQHRPTRQAWRDSQLRLGLPSVEAGLLRVQVGSNDGGLDDAYDDLVLECSLPISRCEHVVYGEVTTHDASSPFNPRRDDYLVIDAPVDVPAVCSRYPALEAVIGKLYPQRWRMTPGLQADLSPLLLPNGLPGAAVGLRFESRLDEADRCAADQDAAVKLLQASVGRVPFQAHAMEAGATILTRAELGAIAQLRDQLMRQTCDMTPAEMVLLRFERYHRSASESAGGAYRGTGLREQLGQAMTDGQGRYLFRFRQRRGETSPDLLVQVSAAGCAPCFETAPYDRVANLRRIDLCVPQQACLAPARRPRLQPVPTPERVSEDEKRAAEAALCRRRCS
ncbi:hypothetical protein LRS03_13075 [Rhizobacter sp. J219]|uniref:hypothetical protein n=1 Tax=Rhizobacter sp. J219 TaxID=2898430 RepID=UPI0021509823|nr:hypothetical protein [Rhizobacter sp. J219]MCR5883738.1 hypothetical protein [Rhizobacter sp. J219]